MKTAEEIAREVLGPDALAGIGYDKYLPYMVRAIEADRAQRDVYEMTADVRRDDKGAPLATVKSDALTVHVGRSTVDGVPYVMIDTMQPGRMRVDLNDGTIWDEDPEVDVPALLDGFAVVDDAGTPLVNCNRCGYDAEIGYKSLRAYVVAAKNHHCMEES